MRTCKQGHRHDEKRCPECQRMYGRRYRRSPKGREKDRLWQLANYDRDKRYERYMRLEWPHALEAQREAALDQIEALNMQMSELGLPLNPGLLAYLEEHRPDPASCYPRTRG